MTYTKHSGGSSLTLIVAETAGRDVLFNGANRACESLSCRTDLVLPQIDTIKVDLSLTQIKAATMTLQSNGFVLAGVQPNDNITHAINICAITTAANIPLAIAEQSVGSQSGKLAAGDLLSLISEGLEAIFTEYDFIADDAVLRLVLEHQRRAASKAILIGDPARRLKSLLEEIKLQWGDPDTEMVYRPEVTFRVACALTQVPQLDRNLDTREKIAHALNDQGWFPYNVEDTRKAVGSLTRVWGLHTKTLQMLPHEARRRGFPQPREADVLFNLIENIDTDERVFTSASGSQFDILYISEI